MLTAMVSEIDLLLRLLVAAVLGGAIGIERGIRGKAAGFRTHLLICIGAALLTYLSAVLSGSRGGEPGDPARIAAQVVSALGFLGGGVILRTRGAIKGITTAATIWVVAAIGMAAGAGQFKVAAITTVLVLIALVGLDDVAERIVQRGRGFHTIRITLHGTQSGPQIARELLSASGLNCTFVEGAKSTSGESVTVTYNVLASEARIREVMERLLEHPNVKEVGVAE